MSNASRAFKATLVAAGIALALPSHAQGQLIGGIFSGLGNIITQTSNKIGSSVTGGDKLANIEEERTKYFLTTEKQLAGMDPASKKQLMVTLEKQWEMAENALLMQNMKVQQAKDAPLIDFGQVLKASASGVASTVGMGSAMSGGVGDILTGATLEGLIAGATDTAPVNSAGVRAGIMSGVGYGGVITPASPGAVVTGAATTAVAGGVSNAVSNIFSGVLRGDKAAQSEFKFPEKADPTKFLGVAPSTLMGKDLYRENGYLGWKRIDGSQAQGAEAYAPVGGDPNIKAAVYTFDKQTGAVTAAFRILTVPPTEFTKVVQALDAQMGPSRYASTGSILRAVWADGSFATADQSKITVGWSSLIPAVYAQATN